MKSWLKSGLAILIGVMILLMGSGVSIAKMVCIKSGHTEIAINTVEDCCGHEQEAPVSIEGKCCDVSSLQIEAQQFLVSSSQHLEKAFVCIEVPTVLFSAQALNNTPAVVREYVDPDITSSPPLRILFRSFQI